MPRPTPRRKPDDECARAAGEGTRVTRVIAVSLLLLALAAWTATALWFQAPGGPLARTLLIGLWVLFAAAVLTRAWRGPPWPALVAFGLAFGAVLLWWHALKPSNEREWADDVARTSHGEINGDQVTLHNLRNFEWRTNTDYTVRWETRRYSLLQLQSLDMITSYWASRAIAHLLFSFGFADGEQVVFSVEIRRERQESYNTIGGLFKQFELSVIAADERDIIRVRTNVRGEDDYLYRLQLPADDIRALFLAYIAQANELVGTPRFYNTLTVNCTTLVYQMLKHILGTLPLSYRVLLSGYLPEYVYSLGGLDGRYTLAQLRAMGRITERARAATGARFSRDIRAGIPSLGT
jgi:hypothetical protein